MPANIAKDMLKRANEIKEQTSAENVTFVKSKISDIALPNEVADCIISNCVINLVPEMDKPMVFKEMYRLLKPGGRVAVSDVLAKKELPEHVKNDIALYVGCIAGASQTSEYERYLRDAGFKGIPKGASYVVPSSNDLSAIDILIHDARSDLNLFRTGENGAPFSPVRKRFKSLRASWMRISIAERSLLDGTT